MARRKTDDLYTVVANAKRGVDRLKLTLPFPVDPDTFYRLCLPSAFWEAGQARGAQEVNLHALYNTTNCVQFSLMDEDEFVKASKEVTTGAFWLEFPEEIYPAISASHSESAFIVPRNHPMREKAIDWMMKARELDERIDQYEHILDDTYQEFGSLGELTHCWPELARAAGVAQLKRRQQIDPKREKILRRALTKNPEVRRKQLVEDLAAASLLPDDLKLKAWVDWK